MIIYEVGRVQRQAAQFSGSRSVRVSLLVFLWLMFHLLTLGYLVCRHSYGRKRRLLHVRIPLTSSVPHSFPFPVFRPSLFPFPLPLQPACNSLTSHASSIVLIAQITYGTNHVSNYFFNDCIPPAAALAAVLVHVRAVLQRGSERERDLEMTPVKGSHRRRSSSWGGVGSDARASTGDEHAEAWAGPSSAWSERVERRPSTAEMPPPPQPTVILQPETDAMAACLKVGVLA